MQQSLHITTGSEKTFTIEGFEYDINLKPMAKVKISKDELVGVLIPQLVKFLFEQIKNLMKR